MQLQGGMQEIALAELLLLHLTYFPPQENEDELLWSREVSKASSN